MGQLEPGLKDVDDRIEAITNNMKDYDMLIVTADHGCDPTFKGHTDHTREFTPLIVYSSHVKPNVNLGLRESFTDISATISEIFGLQKLNGTSFLEIIYR